MARPLKPLGEQSDPDPLKTFAAQLRHFRRRMDNPPLRVVAERAGVSVGLLSAAHSGTSMPTWKAVAAYVEGCGGNPDWWAEPWDNLQQTRACATARPAVQRWARHGTVHVPMGASEAELVAMLAEMRTARGLTLRQIAQEGGLYSHHTYGAVLRGTRPLTPDALLGLLRSFEINRPNDVVAWMVALLHVRPQDARTITRILHVQERRRRQGQQDRARSREQPPLFDLADDGDRSASGEVARRAREEHARLSRKGLSRTGRTYSHPNNRTRPGAVGLAP